MISPGNLFGRRGDIQFAAHTIAMLQTRNRPIIDKSAIKALQHFLRALSRPYKHGEEQEVEPRYIPSALRFILPRVVSR